MCAAAKGCIKLSYTDAYKEALCKQYPFSFLYGNWMSLPHFDHIPENDRQAICAHQQAVGIVSLSTLPPFCNQRTIPPPQ